MVVYDKKTKKLNQNETPAANANANAAANVAAQPYTVNPYGTTQGRYASYSAYTIPSPNSKYDKKLDNTLGKIEKYGPYNSPVQAGLDKYTNLVTNPEEFNSQWADYVTKYGKKLEEEYDPNSDPSYLAYKNQYLAGGQKAMQDTLAKAAALTGGYGSSYGQSAGQQTYNDYMTALADKIPELAQAAYEMNLSKLNAYNNLYGQDWDMYNDDRSYNMNALNALSGLDNNYYSRWSGERDNLYNLLSAYEGLDDRDYSRFKDEYSMWKNAYSDLTKGSGGRGGGGSKSSKDDYDLIEELQYANKKGASVGSMLKYAQEALANGDKVVIPGSNQALPQGVGTEYVYSLLRHLQNQRNAK